MVQIQIILAVTRVFDKVKPVFTFILTIYKRHEKLIWYQRYPLSETKGPDIWHTFQNTTFTICWWHCINSRNQTNLQNALQCLEDYRDDWKLDVNTEKQILYFFLNKNLGNLNVFYFIICIVKTVDSFKYLGTVFNYNGSLVMHKKHIVAQAHQLCFLF